MNKILQKVAKLTVGLAMAAGVGVAVSAGRKDISPAQAATASITFTSDNFTGLGSNNYGSGAERTGSVTGTDSETYNLGSKYTTINSGWQWQASNGITYNKTAFPGRITTISVTQSTTKQFFVRGGTSECNAKDSGTQIGSNQSSASMSWTVPSGTDYTYFVIGRGSNAAKVTQIVVTFEVAASDTLSSVSSSGHKTSFADAETFSYGGTLTATYNAGTASEKTKTVTPTSYKYGASGINPTSAGTAITIGTALSYSTHNGKYIYVLYTESGSTVYTSYQISVSAPKVLSSISVSGQTTTFDQGDTFAFGGTVTAHYDDTSTLDVTASATFSGYDLSTSGSQTVTVSYGGKTTTYTITVNGLPQYELITSTDDLVAGSSYLIGHNESGTNYFLSTTQNSNNRSAVTGTVTDDVVTKTASMQVIELGGTSENWQFIVGDGPNYLHTSSTSANRLQTTGTLNDNARWTISITAAGVASISNKGNTSRGGMAWNANSGSPIFSCYSSGGSLNIYKHVDTTESIQISQASVSDMKGNTNRDVFITANNFTPTGITATYSVASIAAVTAGTISDGKVNLNIACTGVGSTVATITVTGSSSTLTVDLSITVTQKPASLTLDNSYIEDGEIEVKLGGTRQISFLALDTDGDDYSIDYSGITATSSNNNICSLSGTTNMILNGNAAGDVTVTCTITVTAAWQIPISQTLTVHVIPDYNEKNVSISVTNGVNVDQGEELAIADHISSATATTHFGINNHAIEDDELLFSYTNNRSAAVLASSFVWDVTDPDLNEGEFETRTVYVFVTFNESYAGTSFTAVVKVQSRPVVGLKVDGVSKTNGADINLELPRNSSYNFNEHVTVDPVNATQSHSIDYAVQEGSEYVSVTNGVMTIGSKTGETVACVSATPVALSSYTIYFWVSITREAMTITADVPTSGWSMATSLEVGDEVIIVNTGDTMELSAVTSNVGTATSYSGTPEGTYTLTVGEGRNGGFTFSNGTDYLAYTNTSTSKNNNIYIVTSPSTEDEWKQVSWTVELSGTNAEVNNVYNTSRYLQYNANSGQERFCGYTGSQQDVSFYKEQTSFEPQQVTVTDALFNVVNGAMSLKGGSSTLYDLGLCNASGASFNVSSWNALGNSFTSAIKEDNKLAYARSNESGNEIEQFLAVYDYVIGKKISGYTAYASANDFLGRVASGKISGSPVVNPLINVIGENTNTVAIIVIISMVSVTAIGGYFFLRKRKENQ